MPQASRTFRIFVSSTFSDLKAERNALQTYVFPRLRELCQQHGASFQAIDLRWGVSEEASLDQQAMNICLGEIERCQRVTPRPNFIILLGDRYGWRPLPFAIPAAEMERMLPRLSPEERRLALWDEDASCDSVQDAADQPMVAWHDGNPTGDHGWYRLDTNAVPAAYLLQPRPHDSPFADYGDWDMQVERPLHAILERAARETIGISGESESLLLKYTASATHQEIVHGALRVAAATEHVFGFFRTIVNLPEGIAALPVWPACDYVDVTAEGAFDVAAHNGLRDLKNNLATQLGANVVEYQAHWTGMGLTTDLIGTLPATLEECLKLNEPPNDTETLCKAVWRRISRVILDQVAGLESVDPLVTEQEAHDAFGAERSRFFTGRADFLRTIRAYVRGDSRYPLMIWGGAGSGKSALLAKAVEEVRQDKPNAQVIARFIGATPASSSIHSLMQGLCKQILRACDLELQMQERLAKIQENDEKSQQQRQAVRAEYEVPEDTQKLFQTFRRFLALIPQDRELALFIDGLDQLADAQDTRHLIWLTADLPPNARVILSALSGQGLDPWKSRLPDDCMIELTPMDLSDGAVLLDNWLAGVSRQVTPWQKGAILTKFSQYGLPLYLKLAFEEARLWKSYDAPPVLAHDTTGAIETLFARLAQDENHGQVLVSRSLGYLAAAKNGLSEDEMLDVLWTDGDVQQDFWRRSPKSPKNINALPVVVWSRLYLDLEPYLTERQADNTVVLSFYHRQVGEAAALKLALAGGRSMAHSKLADYFQKKADPALDRTWTGRSVRGLSELPHHLIHAQRWDAVLATLSDLGFIAEKSHAGLVYDLLVDYHGAQEGWPDQRPAFGQHVLLEAYAEQLKRYASAPTGLSVPEPPATVEFAPQGQSEQSRRDWTPSERLRAWRNMVSNHLVEFQDAAIPAFQIAYNDTQGGPVAEAMAERRVGCQAPDSCWIRRVNRPAWVAQRACLSAFELHASRVTSVALSYDGRYGISGSWDHTVQIWDLVLGVPIGTLVGHAASVHCVAATPDFRLVASGDSEGTIRLWDRDTQMCLRTFQGHTERLYCEEGHTDVVRSVSITPDGRLIVSGGEDRTVRVWDTETGTCLKTIYGNRARADAFSDLEFSALLPEYREQIRQRAKIGRDPAFEVSCLAVTLDLQQAMSGGEDRLLRVWDLPAGKVVRELAGHTQGIEALAFAPKHGLVVTASRDATVRIWDMQAARCVRVIEHVPGYPTAIALTPNARYAVTGGSDKLLRVWDLDTGQLALTFEGHTEEVTSVAMTPDGRFALSGSTDRTVRFWDLAHGISTTSAQPMTAELASVVVARHRRHVFAVGSAHSIDVWDSAVGTRLRSLTGHTDRITAMAATPDDRHLLSASADHTLRLWDAQTGIEEMRVTLSGPNDMNSGHVSKILITTDSNYATILMTRGICLFDLHAYTWLKKKDRVAFRTHAALTPDGRYLACGDGGGFSAVLAVYDIENEKIKHFLSDTNFSTVDVVVSADGGYCAAIGGQQLDVLATPGADVLVWDLATGKPVETHAGHRARLTCLALMPNGRQFLSGSSDLTVKLWDFPRADALMTLEGHSAPVSALDVSEDGGFAVSACTDQTVRIWDLTTGKCVCTYRTPGGDIEQVVVRYPHLVIMCKNGTLDFLEIRSHADAVAVSSVPVITAVRPYHFGSTSKPGHFDDALSATCPYCGTAIRISTKREKSARWGIFRRSNSNRPAEQAVLGQTVTCPDRNCARRLKLNPFAYDGMMSEHGQNEPV